ncbi:MAG: (d)CMP kinase [Chitinivibrionales bacterium]
MQRVIAIDGPAGSGKSSTARAVAQRLAILYLDTGAMYRAITLKCLRQGVSAADNEALGRVVAETKLRFAGMPPDVKLLMDGEDVSEAIRSDKVTRHVSDYCAPAIVREALVAQQRAIVESRPAVAEGRDIGTVVFPRAMLKFYMVASVEQRAKRRMKDFEALGEKKSLEEIIADIKQRDRKDSTRENSPLRKAEGAEEVDTTDLTLDQQIAYICDRAVACGLVDLDEDSPEL